MKAILTERDAFARTLGPAVISMTDIALHDHAQQILQAVANDIEPSKAPSNNLKNQRDGIDVRDRAASEHGKICQEDDCTMIQMVAEYRALRANDLPCFNEAIA